MPMIVRNSCEISICESVLHSAGGNFFVSYFDALFTLSISRCKLWKVEKKVKYESEK